MRHSSIGTNLFLGRFQKLPKQSTFHQAEFQLESCPDVNGWTPNAKCAVLWEEENSFCFVSLTIKASVETSKKIQAEVCLKPWESSRRNRASNHCKRRSSLWWHVGNKHEILIYCKNSSESIRQCGWNSVILISSLVLRKKKTSSKGIWCYRFL